MLIYFVYVLTLNNDSSLSRNSRISSKTADPTLAHPSHPQLLAQLTNKGHIIKLLHVDIVEFISIEHFILFYFIFYLFENFNSIF